MYINTNEETEELRRLADKLFSIDQEDLAFEALSISRGIMSKTILGDLPSPHILMNLKNLLIDNKINFAVIGGLAVNVHGQARATEDIDVLVESFPPPERLRDSEYMERFGFYKARSSTGTVLALETRTGQGYVEMLLVNDPLRVWALDKSRMTPILGVGVPVITAESLVALKIVAASNSPKRKEKDLPDIISVLLKSTVNVAESRCFLTEKQNELLDKLTDI